MSGLLPAVIPSSPASVAAVTDEDPGARHVDYRAARIGAALALVGVVVILLLIDAVSTDYEAHAMIVTSVLGAAAALLGVEIIDFIRRKP